MAPRIARSLDVLRAQVNLAHPKRDKSSDGWIGDAAHALTKSEHNPNAKGVVRALDITHDPAHGVNARVLAQTLLDSRDPRILLVISNAEIARSYPKKGTTPWQWSEYTGRNAHRQHCHISVVEDERLYDDGRSWDIGKPIPMPQPRPDSAPTLTGVAWIQSSLNRLVKPKVPLDVDGKYGARTRTAVRQFQKAHGLEADGWAGPLTMAAMKAELEKGRS